MGCKMLQKKMMIPPHQQSQASKSRAIGGGEDTSVRLSKTVISCWKQASSGSYWILLLAQPAPSRSFQTFQEHLGLHPHRCWWCCHGGCGCSCLHRISSLFQNQSAQHAPRASTSNTETNGLARLRSLK